MVGLRNLRILGYSKRYLSPYNLHIGIWLELKSQTRTYVYLCTYRPTYLLPTYLLEYFVYKSTFYISAISYSRIEKLHRRTIFSHLRTMCKQLRKKKRNLGWVSIACMYLPVAVVYAASFCALFDIFFTLQLNESITVPYSCIRWSLISNTVPTSVL